ncbi:MAG: hypothetical protein MUC53_00145 [Candidatus Contendobacter sp.]|jgi:hypothetical protein|nr:hypothetical protein [Candidatus Contendobacter sp.]
MSNILGFAVARRTSRGNLLAGWLAGGEIRVYDGTRPADADTAITTQTLLVTFALADPSGTVTNGVFTGTNPAAALIAASGTAAWARVVDDSAGTICDADVGIASSGAVIEIDNLSLVEGGYCTITSFVLTER